MAIMRIKTGESVEIALKKPNGELRASNVPNGRPEVMYTLCGDEKWFATQDAAEEITKLGIKPFEPFRVTGGKRGGLPYYTIERVEEQPPETHIEAQLRESLEQQRASNPSKSAPAAAPSGPHLVSPDSTTNRTNQTQLAQLLSGCIVAAIDAAVVGRDYAHSKGLTISLTEQSIQDLTSTLMIHIQRMAELECKYEGLAKSALARTQNGGGKWQR